MKNLNSNQEGIWLEQLELTNTQIEVLQNGKLEEKQSVIDATNVTPSETDLQLANELYNLSKPSEEGFELIGCNITLCDNPRGIINCRINGEHKQIRF